MVPHALREALAGFRRAPLLIGTSVAMIALSLLVVGLFGIAAHNIRVVLEGVEARVQVVTYLHDEATPTEVRNAQEEVSSYPEVAEVLYISREHALALARAELGDFGAIFSELETNPLPASLEITMLPGNRTPEIVSSVAARVSEYPFVEEVRYGQDWLDRVFLLRRIAGAAAVVLGGAFAAVAVLIIGAAVRIAIFARRQEISIMRLVGATDGFVRRPFLLEGLITGLLGAGTALSLTYATHRLLSSAVFPLEWLPDTWIAAGLTGGALLGVLASGIAVRRHLREV